MAISYNPETKSWEIDYFDTNYKTDYKTDYDTARKTDYKTDYPTNLPTNLKVNHAELAQQAYNEYNSWDQLTLARGVRYLYMSYLGRTPSSSETEAWREALKTTGWVPGKGINGQDFKWLKDKISNSDERYALEETYFNNALQNDENKKTNEYNATVNKGNQEINESNIKANQKAKETNEINAKINEENKLINTQNKVKNDTYDKTVQIANKTLGGDYVSNRDQINAQALIDAGIPQEDIDSLISNAKEAYKSFYVTEKLQTWDPALGKTPPYGTFDPKYYKEQNPTILKAWEEAVANDDIDITLRYGENGFYLQHYTNVGYGQGLRGNKEEDTVAVNKYLEETPTDQEIQQIRDIQLGVDRDSIASRILNIPEVSNEWTKARNGDEYWKKLAKDNYLDVDKPEDFAVLFRLSERPEDKQISLNYNVNAGTGITELEDAINQAIGTKAEVDVKKFAALNQNILKDTIQEMKKVKAQQEVMSFYRGFSGFSEVIDINQQLANSILGDTGVGGILSYTSGGKAEQSLLGALQGVSGMRNNVVYNWQQWFDQAIKDKYGIDYSLFEPLEEKKDVIAAFGKLESGKKAFNADTNQFDAKFLDEAGFKTTEELVDFLNKQGEEGQTILNAIKGDAGETANSILKPIQARLEADIKVIDETKNRGIALDYKKGDVTEIMNIEAQFARDYIDEYLIPRFNTARSMDEFVEYLDVRQQEQNPFQTQDAYNAVQSLSELYTKQYLDKIKQTDPRSFDPEFYFNPTGDVSRESDYAKQKADVEADWEAAKNGDEYWAQQAYRFGIDLNDKASFARMHFEVKGQGQGYDAADDIVNAGKVKDYLYQTVLPALKEEALKQGSVFGQFITPEEFADEMLRGLDPSKTPDQWEEILQRYGLSDFKGNIEELRQYIIETLRTGAAQDIREQIKFLNEKRQRPTQQILGVTYIDRPKEDYKDEMAKPTTQLYAIFQKAGYQGTEDEFYEKMFPDLDRSEQALLTKAGKDDPLKTYGLDFTDPFASLGTIESFFPEDIAAQKKEQQKESPTESYTSYFKIDEDAEEEDYKSDAAKAFLGEFTSMFKGL